MSPDQQPLPLTDNQSGTRPLRVVITLMILAAITSALGSVRIILAGDVPILAPLFTLLFLIAGVGLMRRSCLGLRFAILLTWFAFIRNVIGVILVAIALFSPNPSEELQAISGLLWLSFGLGIVRLVVHVILLRVLYSPKTLALMNDSTSPLAAPGY
ncbi:MAG: hypothetical protein ACIAQF_00410 [Phycisphaerales bacterium JB065]